jgi:hypothetical protein
MSSFREIYYTFDQPVPYKSLLIYPIKIQDYYEFLFFIPCLMLEKNSIKDPNLAIKAISMSYLAYMYEISTKENNYTQLFDGLLRLVLKTKDKEKNIKYGYEKDNIPYFMIDNKKYYSEDFDEIRKIISEQNLIDLPDEKIQKNVRDALEEARRFKQKLNNNKMASFEEQMMALATYTGWSLEEIYNMTYRKFILAIRRANQIIMSNIYLTASMSGFVSFKDKSILKSWISDVNEDDKYADVKMSPEQLQSKANFEEAKTK